MTNSAERSGLRAIWVGASVVSLSTAGIHLYLMAIAVASIASYFHVGVLDALGNIDKAIEVLLILLLTADAATTQPDEDLAGRYAGGISGAIAQLVVGIVAGLVMFLALTPFLV